MHGYVQEVLQAEKARLQLLLTEEERSASAAEAQHSAHVGSLAPHGPQSAGSAEEEEKEDELDAFMGQVAVQLEHDKVLLLLL